MLARMMYEHGKQFKNVEELEDAFNNCVFRIDRAYIQKLYKSISRRSATYLQSVNCCVLVLCGNLRFVGTLFITSTVVV